MHDGSFSRFLGRPVPSDVVFGHQLAGLEKAPQDAVIHYNMLHPVFSYEGVPLEEVASSWDFCRDPGFARLEKMGVADSVVVVSPLDELISRMRTRAHFEPDSPSDNLYPGDRWEEVVSTLNLFSIYDSLFEILESTAIDYQVVLSSTEVDGGFRPTDRLLVAHHLAHKGGCPHVGGTREETFDLILGPDLLNVSVLNAACTLGDLLFRAERLERDRLVGRELSLDRFEAAVVIADCCRAPEMT